MAFDLTPTTSADTQEFALTEGQEICLSLYTANGKGAPARSFAYIEQEVATDVWKVVDVLSNTDDEKVWRAVGQWRINKPESASAFGVLGT